MATDDATRVDPSPLDTDEIPIFVAERRSPPAWARSLTLGSAATVLAGLLVLTGLVLMFHVRPQPALAHLDVVDLVEVSSAGFVRALHVWGSHLLLIAALLHLFRVVIAGDHRSPRRGNYGLGVALLFVVLALAVSGRLLPWDGVAHRLLEVVGLPPEGSTLLAAYALHCGVLPVAGALLLIVHWRRAVRNDEAEDGPKNGPKNRPKSETDDGDEPVPTEVG